MEAKFLKTLKQSFIKYLQTSSRSNEKLKILHSRISNDILCIINDSKYDIFSLNEDVEKSKELEINGRYVNKKVDIVVSENSKIIAGVAVKFIMFNYSQNSNNYFENMLGETANIRCNKIPYFQIIIIFDKLPYFERNGNISKWEEIKEHNIDKYIKLSEDNIDFYMHMPNKILFYVIHIDINKNIKTKQDYIEYYLTNDFILVKSDLNLSFESNVIYNNYKDFIKKICYHIKSI